MLTNAADTLGFTFKDAITGFTGVATGFIDFISGCSQVALQPKATDGKMQDSQWFDVTRLEHVTDVPRVVVGNARPHAMEQPRTGADTSLLSAPGMRR